MRRVPHAWLLICAGVFSYGPHLYAVTPEAAAEPVRMTYEIVGTVPEEGFIIKGKGGTRISYLVKDELGMDVKEDRIADLKAAVEILLVNGRTLHIAYRVFMVFPEEYWPGKGNDSEQFPSKMELEVPLDDMGKLDGFQEGGHAERFAEDLAGASLSKLEALGFPVDEGFAAAFKRTLSELLRDLHAGLPDQISRVMERFHSQVRQEAEARAAEEAGIKAEAAAARAGLESGENAEQPQAFVQAAG